jgi:nicotinate phosphoribosyltransferase
MSRKTLLYNQSLALLTDLYELTMANGYLKSGKDREESVFHLYFRNNPFKGGYTIASGLQYLIDLLESFRFEDPDVQYLSTLEGNDGQALFDREFLDYLLEMRLECDVDAVPEGTVMFPQEPLVRIQGPILQCQILESICLNTINFQSLIATKSARICMAARGDPVIEFGLRRAQGIDGAMAASRAAYIGGCVSTSNVLAGKIFGIPVGGTHAHSWIMSFDDESQAFHTYAKAMPNNCIFLVDTYNTIEGVRKAVKVGKWLRKEGHEMVGIRLDSGDLAYLSIEARKILDQEGFPDAVILASNDLDERIIESLKDQGSRINVWGVGTKMVTGYDQPALGAVYKLSAIRGMDGRWNYKVKLSEQTAKVSNPGIQQVRRYYSENENLADAIYDINTDLSNGCTIIDPFDLTRRKLVPQDTKFTDLLVPILRKGKRVYQSPSLPEIRNIAKESLKGFHFGIKRRVNPHRYPVGLEKSLFDLKTELMLKLREKDRNQNSTIA